MDTNMNTKCYILKIKKALRAFCNNLKHQANYPRAPQKHIFLKRHKQTGVALMISLFAVIVLSFIAVELSYDVSIEYIISNKEYHRLKAYYAAKAGVELSRLRIHIYKQAFAQLGQQLAGQQHLLDMIWNFPLVWPITSVLPAELGRVEREQIQDTVSESLMGSTQYTTQILSEGSKIDINDLASEIEALRDMTRMQLINIFDTNMENEESYGRTFPDYDYEQIVDNITDWVDRDQNGQKGGAESNLYSQIVVDNDIRGDLPPNRPFRTLQEVKMVNGVTNKIYNLLAPHITVYGNKGINPNYAGTHLLKTLDARITDEVVAAIEERKSDPSQGLFQNAEDFFTFLDGFIDTQSMRNKKIPFYFGSEYNFMIKSTGLSNNVQKDIIAIVYDVEATASNLSRAKTNLQNNKANPNPTSASANTKQPTNNNTTNTQQAKAPTGPPVIVYWYEP